jgi:hypothetical protein
MHSILRSRAVGLAVGRGTAVAGAIVAVVGTGTSLDYGPRRKMLSRVVEEVFGGTIDCLDSGEYEGLAVLERGSGSIVKAWGDRTAFAIDAQLDI